MTLNSIARIIVFCFVKWYDTFQVQSNTEVYSSFASIYINPVIWLMLDWVVWGSGNVFALVGWLLINIVREGVKTRVGLEKLYYEICTEHFTEIFQAKFDHDGLVQGSCFLEKWSKLTLK